MIYRTAMRTNIGYVLPLIVVSFSTVSRLTYCVDDGYIFARVARNLLRGQGWAFNPGEPVNAMTSVLWTLVLVPTTALGPITSPTMAVLFGLSVFLLSAAVASFWAHSCTKLTGYLLAAVCAACPTLWDSVGLETALEAALVAWTIVAYSRNRVWLAGVLLGLAILGRPDAGLLGLTLITWSLWRRRQVLWQTLVAAGLVVAPWAMFAHHEFGSVVPVTLQAKTIQSSLGWWGQQPPFAFSALLHDGWPLVALAVAIAAVVLAPRMSARMPLGARIMVSYGIVHAIAYTVIRAPSGYFWYFVPLHLSLILGAGWGAICLIAHMRRKFAASVSRRGALASASTIAVAAIVGVFVSVTVARGGIYRQAELYKQAAAAVKTRSSVGDRVAAVEIGYIGYFSDRPVIDIHGLIHPEALPRIARGESLWWLDQRPRFVVTHQPSWDAEPGPRGSPPEASASFVEEYETIERFGVDGAVLLWKRRGEQALAP